MLSYEALKIINRHIKIYNDFPLPAIICDTSFQVYWSNRRARDSFARLSEPEGVAGVLSGFDLEALFEEISEKSGVTLSGVLPFSDISINLSPIVTESDIVGITVLLVSSLGVPMPSDETTRAAEAFSEGMRRGVDNIFSALDSAYLKSVIMDETQWLSPHLNQITTGAYRLLRMGANFTEYTKLQSGIASQTFENVDILTWLRGISEAIGVIAQKAGIPVTFDIESGSAFARVEISSLETAFFNIVYNSLFFTRENNRIEISAFKSGGVSIVVNDLGLGMDSETLNNAAKPFYACSNAKGNRGAGLGLTLARLIMNAHNGDITIESSLGSGTTVTLSFPPIPFSHQIPLEQGEATLEMARDTVKNRFSALHIGLMGIYGETDSI